MGEINSHRDLLVWQQAMDLAVTIYEVSRSWPKEETYGLTSQARRAAVSVCANIAEGYGRENRGSYLQFLRIAQGSLKEVETHLELAARIGIASRDRIAGPRNRAKASESYCAFWSENLSMTNSKLAYCPIAL